VGSHLIVKFTQRQIGILIGSILGDAYVQKTGTFNSRIRFEHGAKQKEYVFWKYHQLSNLFKNTPKYIERKHPKTLKIYKYWRHQSKTDKFIGKLQSMFYVNGKKVIPRNLQSLLKNDISLAVWYMDDRYFYRKDNSSYLYLGRVKKAEAKIAVQTIIKNFGIECVLLDKHKKGFVIYFSPKKTTKLHAKIKKLCLPMFNYKFRS